MRTSPEYHAAITGIAGDPQAAYLPSFELENAAAAIGADFGVNDADVINDIDAAMHDSTVFIQTCERT